MQKRDVGPFPNSVHKANLNRDLNSRENAGQKLRVAGWVSAPW